MQIQKIKNKANGFSVVEACVILFVLVAISAIGFYILQVRNVNATVHARVGSNTSWTALAISADGSKLFGAQDYIYTSSNRGQTWSPQKAPGSQGAWVNIASSASGSELMAITRNKLLTSDDGGSTWSDRTYTGFGLNSIEWDSIAVSADGKDFIAGGSEGGGSGMYISYDSGNSWHDLNQPYAPKTFSAPASITLSNGARKIVVATSIGDIFISTDGGHSWTDQETAGVREWTSIASSADGEHIIATYAGSTVYSSKYSAGFSGNDNGGVYISYDGGKSWDRQSSFKSGNWISGGISSDGKIMVVASNESDSKGARISVDGGKTWHAPKGIPVHDIYITALSANGKVLALGSYSNGNVWVVNPLAVTQ